MACTTFQWTAPTAVSCALYTEIHLLADGAFSAPSGVIDNENLQYEYIDLEVILGALSPAAGAFVDIWTLQSIDNGTSYADCGKSLQTSTLLTTAPLDTTASTAQRIVLSNVPIAPLKQKLVLRNKAGVTIPNASALRYRLHTEQGI